MFNTAKFEFTQEVQNITLELNVGADLTTETKVYLDREDDAKKVIVCNISEETTNEDLLKIGEKLSTEISANFNVELNAPTDFNLKLIIENMLVGLTPTNIYSKTYELPQKYLVNAPYEFESAYIDASSNALSYNFTRILNHMPHAECNPDSIIPIIEKMFVSSDVNITVLRKEECKSLNMNGMLALSQASRFEPTIIKIEYKTDQSLPHIGLVGKGVMFDTGGYSIKVGRDISNMKADMGGASAIIGTMHNIVTTHQKANVTAYVMITDNMINNEAIIPGDIITYANGLSVEVANTDAEGRLILADGILLAKIDNVDQIIDVATLTGNAVAALGTEYAALYSNNQDLANDMLSVNSLSNDKVWQMPLASSYISSLKGNISDLRNISSLSSAGSITAALFLQHFAENTNWMHIDMAAQTERSEFGTKYSGYGVRLLTNYIKTQK